MALFVFVQNSVSEEKFSCHKTFSATSLGIQSELLVMIHFSPQVEVAPRLSAPNLLLLENQFPKNFALEVESLASLLAVV